MSLLLSWLVFPALSLLVLWGCGLLVARAAGHRPPAGVLLGLGLCVVIVVASLAIQTSATAGFAAPAVVVLALAGLLLERRALRPGFDVWGLAAVLGVFAVYAAPVVLSGSPTFGGYSVLGDTAVHFLASDQLLRDGLSFGSLAPSEYRSALEAYYEAASYPAGSQLGAATLRSLVGVDIAWVFQPYLALLCALMAAAMWSLVSEWVPSRPLRALVVFVAAQPALLYAYALQGSVKEVAAIWIVVLVAALLPDWRRTCVDGPRRAIPLVLATAGAMNILSLAILPWLAPLLLIALVLAVRGAGLRGAPLLRSLGLFAGLALVLSIPALRQLGSFVDTTTTVVTGQAEFGNLLGPLDVLQSAGIWLQGDFRLPLAGGNLSWTYALLGVAAVALVALAVWVVEERRWFVLGLAGTMLLAALYVTHRGSPWADGKALAISSPMLLLGVMLGAASLVRRVPVIAWTMAGALTCGVLVSSALAYHSAVLAPYDRLQELREIGEDYAGRGPATVTDFDDFSKHFLRDLAPAGGAVQTDVDALPLDVVASRPLIVRRRSPLASRPPASFVLDRRGRFYEVWRQRSDAPRVVRHVPLQEPSGPVATPRCADVLRLGREARRAGGALVGAVGQPPVVLRAVELAPFPAGWGVDPNEPETLNVVGPGSLAGTIDVPRAGRYELWLEGSFGRTVEVWIDGHEVARVEDRRNYRQQSEPLGAIRLPAGEHDVRIVRRGGEVWPGTGGVADRIGRLWLASPTDARVVRTDDPRDLCGRSLDWLEIVR